MKKLALFFQALVVFLLFFILSPSSALAAVTITQATGGTNISADKAANAASPAYTTLGNIVIAENANNDISGNGTFTVAPPSGWTFNTTGVTTSVTGGLTATVTSQTATLLTITIGGRRNSTIQSFTIIGLQVRSTDGAVLPNSGNITRAGGSATISGAAAGAILGPLSQTFGAKSKLAFTTQPSTTATVNTDFTTKPVVKVQDQFGSVVTTDSTSTISRTTVMYNQACGGTAGSGTLTSTPASGATVTSGTLTYTAMQYSVGEAIKICAASSGLTSALSNIVSVSPTVTGVSASNADGSYRAGQVIHVQVTFSSEVTASGTPQLILSTGSPATSTANYVSGSGTKVLTFDYTVSAGNTSADLDYSSTAALILNSGTLKDTATGNSNAVLTLPAPGASGSLGANKNIVIDTSAPAAPTAPDLDSVDDTGLYNNDNITNQSVNLTFTGTAEASSTVELFDGVTSKGTVVATGGNYSFTITLLAGTHNMSTVATDLAGNVSASSTPTLIVVVDTTAPAAPSVPDLAAEDDSGFSNTDNITNITTGLTFSGTSEASSTIDIYNGAGLVGSVFATSGAWSLDISLPVGNHEIFAKATDLAGNVSTSSAPTLVVVIDTTAPNTPSAPDLAAEDDTGISDSDNITKLTSGLTLSGTAEDGSIVEIYDGAAIIASTTIVGGVGSVDVSLAPGTHSLIAVAIDLAGNRSASSTPLSITVDTTAPSIPSVPDLDAADDTGISNTDNITKQVSNLTFNGTADVGSTVEIFREKPGEYFPGGSVVATDGTWTFNMFINPGTYSLWTRATDVAGNVSATSSSLIVTVDTSVSPSPSAPDLIAADDTGYLNTDNITNKATGLTFVGTSEADSIVEIFDGVVSKATTTATSGNYSFDLDLASGEHNLSVIATDVAGNISSTSAAILVTVDTSTPATSSAPNLDSSDDTGISNSDGITKLTTGLSIFGTTDANTIVEIFDGATSKGTINATTSGWAIDLDLAAGSHSITAVATDYAGNVAATSSALTIVVDTTAPSTPAAPDLDILDDTGISNTDHITKQNAGLTFLGTTEASSTVELFYDGANSKGTTFTTDGNYSFSTSLTEGTHTLSVISTDVAGNVSATSTTMSITIDTSLPAAPSTPDLAAEDDDGISSTDNITSHTTGLTFSGTAEASSTIELFANLISKGTTTATGGNWTIDISLATGTYNITAVATDAAGNSSVSSEIVVVTSGYSEFATPSKPDLDSEDDTGISNSDDLTKLTSGLTFSGSAQTDSTVIIYDGVTAKATTTATLGFYTFDISLTAGVHDIYVYSYNATSSATSTSLTVTIDTSAPSAPISSGLDASCDTGLYDNDSITKQTANLTGVGTAEPNSTVTIYLDDIDRGDVPVSGAGNWSFIGSMPAGTHYLYAVATDDAGNISSSSTVAMIVVDTTAPAAPSVPDLAAEDDSGFSNTDNITNITTGLTFSGTSEASSTIDIYNGAGLVGSVFATSGVWSLDISLPVGNHEIFAKATDIAGNISLASTPTLVVVVDTSAPSTPSAPDLAAEDDTGTSDSDNITNKTTGLTLSGIAEEGSIVEIFDGATSIASTTIVGGVGSVDVSLAPGSHSLIAVATDLAGNISASSSALVINVDTAAPNIPSVPDLDNADDTGISNTDNITKQVSNITFTGTADIGSTVEIFREKPGEYFPGGSVVATDGTWMFNMFINPGTYSLWTRATDVAGNVSATSSSLIVTVDTSVDPVPSAPDLDSADDTGYSSTDNLTNRSTGLTFAGTSEADSIVEIFDGAVSQATTTATSGNYSFDLNLASGEHNLSVIATDVAGNISTTSDIILVTVDTSTPAISSTPNLDSADDTGYSNSDGITKLTTGLSFFGTTDAGTIVEIFDGAISKGTVTATTSGWAIDINLAEGSHSITAVATDYAGNVAATSSALTIFVDATAPSTPAAPDLDTLDDTGISNTDHITKQTTNLTIIGTVENSDFVEFYLDGNLRGTYPSTAGAWIVEGSIVINGDHVFYVKDVDAAGNASATSSSLTINIDTAAPAISENTPVTTPTNDPTPNYIFNSDEAGAIAYGGTSGCSSSNTAAISGANTVAFNTLTSGIYSCTIKVTDTAGNDSNTITTNTFTVDTEKPVLSIVTPVPSMTNDATPNFTFNSSQAGTITYGGSSGCSSATTAAVNGDNTITFNTLSNGTYSSGSCTIKVTDAAGNQSSILNVNAFTVDTLNPTVLGVTSSASNGIYNAGHVIPIQVNFSETIIVSGTPQLALSTLSPTTTLINYTSGSGSNVLTFEYSTIVGNTSADLDYSSTTALTLNSGTIKDQAGNNAVLTLALPGSAGSLAANKNIVIDSNALVIDIIAATKTSNTTITDTDIHITDSDGVLLSSVSAASSTLEFSDLACVQTDAYTVDCTISINSSGDLIIGATDILGNPGSVTESGYVINVNIPPVPGSTPVPPVAIGDGAANIIIPSGTIRELPQITNDGLNVLLYPDSGLHIIEVVSSNYNLEDHEVTIANLDLLNNIVTLQIESTPQFVTLKLNESAAVDLDGDGTPDVSIKFTNVKVNLMELTIKSLLGEKPAVITPSKPAVYDLALANRLKGRILLQVEQRGEAWYVNPLDAKKYYMANGAAAYSIMRSFGVGITNNNLNRIKTDSAFRKKFIGKIFLQVEAHGEAYYIGFDNKPYYLKDGAAAYQIMRTKGLGVSNSNLEKIPSGALKK